VIGTMSICGVFYAFDGRAALAAALCAITCTVLQARYSCCVKLPVLDQLWFLLCRVLTAPSLHRSGFPFSRCRS
jgi:hypothetical protein